MKNNIVFWGSNEHDQKILTILRLRPNDKKVDIWTFLKEKLNDAFVEQMFADWDEIDTSAFPECNTFEERDVTENDLLPENIKADNTELVIRAEQEWRVQMLSMLLFEMMDNEINALKEQVDNAISYDKTLWETVKGYNNKVNQHNQERNISRSQFGELRKKLNTCFEKLKILMSAENQAYEVEAKDNESKIMTRLLEIEKEAAAKSNLKGLFEELKKIQKDLKDARLTRDGRKKIWDQLNKSFEAVKSQKGSQASSRLQKRMEGLVKAISRMEYSIKQDKGDIEFQNKRANSSHAGKLEMQLREAKIKMINSRIESKEVKLKDMYATMEKLKKQMPPPAEEKEAKKEADTKPQGKQDKGPQAEKKETAKVEGIAAPEIKTEAKTETKVTEAKAETKVEEAKTETKVEEAKAKTAEVKTEAKTETKVEETKAETAEVKTEAKTETKVEEAKAETTEVKTEAKTETKAEEEESLLDRAKDAASGATSKIISAGAVIGGMLGVDKLMGKDDAEDKADKVADKVEEVKDEVKDKAKEEVKDAKAETTETVKDAAEKVEKTTEDAKDTAKIDVKDATKEDDTVVDKAMNVLDKADDIADNIADNLMEKASGLTSKILGGAAAIGGIIGANKLMGKDDAEDNAEKVADKVEEVKDEAKEEVKDAKTETTDTVKDTAENVEKTAEDAKEVKIDIKDATNTATTDDDDDESILDKAKDAATGLKSTIIGAGTALGSIIGANKLMGKDDADDNTDQATDKVADKVEEVKDAAKEEVKDAKTETTETIKDATDTEATDDDESILDKAKDAASGLTSKILGGAAAIGGIIGTDKLMGQEDDEDAKKEEE